MKKLLVAMYAAFLISPLAVLAVTPTEIGTNTCAVSQGALGCGTKGIFGANSVFEGVIYTIVGVAAAVSVLMIVIGGLRYVLSGGDSAGIKSAKDTILYAVVGLVVSLMAGAIIRFVIGAVK